MNDSLKIDSFEGRKELLQHSLLYYLKKVLFFETSDLTFASFLGKEACYT